MVAAATIRIMKIAWVTYLGALSRLNAILIPRISAHPPILAQCKVHRPWALFREGTVHVLHLLHVCKITVFPRNLAATGFYFKAPFGAATIRGRLDFEGGVYRDRHARAYTASIISLFVYVYM